MNCLLMRRSFPVTDPLLFVIQQRHDIQQLISKVFIPYPFVVSAGSGSQEHVAVYNYFYYSSPPTRSGRRVAILSND
jgi:hypothetical protein